MAENVIGQVARVLRRRAAALHREAHREPGDRPDMAVTRQFYGLFAVELEELADSLESAVYEDEPSEP